MSNVLAARRTALVVSGRRSAGEAPPPARTIKDLVGVPGDEPSDLRSILRPPRQVPETMPISRLLRHFQATHELMALVVDESGTTVGCVTLEHVPEQTVGSVEDEFDTEPPPIVEEGPRRFIVLGSTPVQVVNRRLGLDLKAPDVDTLSGRLAPRCLHRIGLVHAPAPQVRGGRLVVPAPRPG